MILDLAGGSGPGRRPRGDRNKSNAPPAVPSLPSAVRRKPGQLCAAVQAPSSQDLVQETRGHATAAEEWFVAIRRSPPVVWCGGAPKEAWRRLRFHPPHPRSPTRATRGDSRPSSYRNLHWLRGGGERGEGGGGGGEVALKAGTLAALLATRPASAAAILDKWRKQRSRKVEPGKTMTRIGDRIEVDAEIEGKNHIPLTFVCDLVQL